MWLVVDQQKGCMGKGFIIQRSCPLYFDINKGQSAVHVTATVLTVTILREFSWGRKTSRGNSLLSSRMSLPHDCCPMLYFDYISLRNPRAYSIYRVSKGIHCSFYFIFPGTQTRFSFFIFALVNFVNSVPYRLRETFSIYSWRCSKWALAFSIN